MKHLLIVWLLLAVALSGLHPAAAQPPDEPDDESAPFRARVDVDDALVRAAPSPDADLAASVFEDQLLEVVGRNLDGTWFEVRRPGRLTGLGWIFNELLDWDFPPEELPLTDITTGVEGPVPLTADPGFAVFMQSGAMLRELPVRDGARVGSVPRFATVPVLARNQDGSWLQVNYIGYVGWIIAFTARELPDVMAVPQAPNLPPLPNVNVIIIPPELQLAHVERMRAFIIPRRDLADSLAAFWFLVDRGEVLPCHPPPEVTEFTYLAEDVQQLPEIARYAPQINDGVSYLNESLDALRSCGVIDRDAIRQARADAINSRGFFNAALGALDSVEEIIR